MGKKIVRNQLKELAYYIGENIYFLQEIYVHASNDLPVKYQKTVTDFSQHIKETSYNIVTFFDSNQERFFELGINDSIVSTITPVVENHQATQNLFDRFTQTYKGSWLDIEDNDLLECVHLAVMHLQDSKNDLLVLANNLN